MMHFTVQDYTAVDASCQKCCCEKLALKPGTISKVSVGYASWAVPIGRLHCVPQFQIEQLETCLTPVNNAPPQITSLDGMARFHTGMNVRLEGDLRTKVTDPEGAVLVFKVLPLYGPKHGKVSLNEDGTFAYVPQQLYKGEDRFYASASDGINDPFIFEVLIAIQIDAGTMVPTPHVSVGAASVDNRYFTVSFPVIVTPAANECEVWRLTVLQCAIDCDCDCYVRTDCFDISVVNC